MQVGQVGRVVQAVQAELEELAELVEQVEQAVLVELLHWHLRCLMVLSPSLPQQAQWSWNLSAIFHRHQRHYH